jgi:branched-chain amino acid transport system substrate-binding protein
VFQRHISRHKAWFSIVSSMIVLLLSLSACGGGDQNTGPTITNNNSITIGISLSLTKDFSSDGLAMQQGYQLWAQMVNNSGGILGRPVTLKILDDQSDPGLAAKNYETLISQDHVDLVMGPFSTLLTKAAAPVVQKHGYAFVEGAGGAPSVFDGVVKQGWHNLFAVSVPVGNNLAAFAYYILSLPKDQRPKTAAYLTSDDPFTYPQLQIAQALLEQGGVKTVYSNTNINDLYPDGNAQKNAADTKQLMAKKPDIVLLGTLLPDLQVEVNLFKQQHFNPQAIIATAGPDLGGDFIHAVGGNIKYTEGFFVPNGWYPQADNFQNAEMVSAYMNQYHVPENQINADIAEAFSVGQVVQQAVTKVGSLDNAKLVAELSSGDVFNTVQGTAKFDKVTAQDAGQNLQAIAYLFQWQGGQFIPVYPYSVAQQNPEYPRPANF